MLLGFIIEPIMKECLRRALLLSRSDPLVFIERPLIATMLAMIVVLLPSLCKKREEVFKEECRLDLASVPETDASVDGPRR